MIRLNVFVKVAEGNRAEVVTLFKELVACTLKEEGCIAYDLFESATRPDVLLICETWSNADTLKAHEVTPHFTKLVPQITALAALKIEKFDF
ncbi:MAG: putative quinol monooxygenase [Phocaeicola sp.]